MPRLSMSPPEVRSLANDALLDLLAAARKRYAAAAARSARDYSCAVVELELEALRRGLDTAPPEEAQLPVRCLPATHRRFAVRQRLEEAARSLDAETFRSLLGSVCPDDTGFAWWLVYAFTPNFRAIAALLRDLYFFALYVRTEDYDAAIAALFFHTHLAARPEHEIVILEKALHEELGLRLPPNSVLGAYERHQESLPCLRKRGHHA